MTYRKWLRIGLLAFLVTLFVGCSGAGQPDAGSNLSGDKKIGSRKGVEESLGSKEIDAEQLPGQLEIGLAIGSTVAMIACLKYL